MNMKGLLTLQAVSAALVFTCAALGETVTIDVSNAGWYTENGDDNSDIGIANTLAGRSGGVEFRSFYVFSLPVLASGEEIAGATLLWESDGTLNSPDGFETYALRSYEGSINDLINSAGSFTDLGDGTDYGEKTFTFSGPDSMEMSAAAVADMNGNLGSDIAFGGIITTLGGFDDEWYRTNQTADGPLFLVLDIVPAPGALALFGVCGLLTRRRRRRCSR